MKIKRYVVLYKDKGKHKWVESNNLKVLQSIFSKCCWIKEYKIIDTSNFKEEIIKK